MQSKGYQIALNQSNRSWKMSPSSDKKCFICEANPDDETPAQEMNRLQRDVEEIRENIRPQMEKLKQLEIRLMQLANQFSAETSKNNVSLVENTVIS